MASLRVPALLQISTKYDVGVFAWICAAHFFALLALFHFTWLGFALFLVMYFVTGCLGVTLGYHRLLSHRSFKTFRWVERVLATFGVLSMQGGPVVWISYHRMHHGKSDQEGDPHNSRRGFWFCHFSWLIIKMDPEQDKMIRTRLARDMVSDPYFVWLQTPVAQLGLQALLGFIFFLWGGWSAVLWGIFFRTVFVYHMTWLVNSACHRWGYRSQETTDLSRNCWWLGILTWGEAWHNNHHAQQSVAPAGWQWWEIDITYGVIRLMRRLGLAWEIKMPAIY